MKKLVVLIIVALLAANIWMMYRNSFSKSCNSNAVDVSVIDSLENIIDSMENDISRKDTQIQELTAKADSLENILDRIRQRLNL